MGAGDAGGSANVCGAGAVTDDLEDFADWVFNKMRLSGWSVRQREDGLIEQRKFWDSPAGVRETVTDVFEPEPRPEVDCRVYWGSHGCHRERHHRGGHVCGRSCDYAKPYYGRWTSFYGEDAPHRGPIQKTVCTAVCRVLAVVHRWKWRLGFR